MSATPSLVLFPGAGTRRDHPTLLAIAREIAPVRVRREEFVYQKGPGRRPPPAAPTLIEEIVACTKKVRGPLILGGRSMGGRMCSMAIAQGCVPRAIGLILVAYPLHPPGRPDRLRTEHFSDIAVPCLLVTGTRDAFGTPEELTSATSQISGAVTHVWIERGTHELRRADEAVASAVKDWVERLEG